ncbi:hypothetical protein BDP27DRAFT_1324890 [Rhodocollybia butyracea]|uniref:Uncharacterized protein n=1 Tax=Rhodocollybia butyracea TaxID=206335 RepID=A0A9P5U7B4_9AGAR|nr:hypothetical protein BDP27DRAFT_1324890 [Rhodocollybia butyracea]
MGVHDVTMFLARAATFGGARFMPRNPRRHHCFYQTGPNQKPDPSHQARIVRAAKRVPLRST